MVAVIPVWRRDVTGRSLLTAAVTVVVATGLDLLIVSTLLDGAHGDFSSPVGLLILAACYSAAGIGFAMCLRRRLMPHALAVFVVAVVAVGIILFVLPLPGEDGGSVASGPYKSQIADGLTVGFALLLSCAWLGGGAIGRALRPAQVVQA